MAGVIPGVMLTLMFMTYIAVRSFWGGAVPRGAPPDGIGVMTALADGPLTLDALIERSGASAGEVLARLVRLELARAVQRRNDGTFAYTR